jgi:hypothetical protein
MYQLNQLIYYLEDHLKEALKNTLEVWTDRHQDFEVEFRRIHYSRRFGMVSFELDRGKYPQFSESLIATGDFLYFARNRPNIRGFDVVDLGNYIYFYYWLARAKTMPPIQMPSTMSFPKL